MSGVNIYKALKDVPIKVLTVLLMADAFSNPVGVGDFHALFSISSTNKTALKDDDVTLLPLKSIRQDFRDVPISILMEKETVSV